jgi:hypothetical protein
MTDSEEDELPVGLKCLITSFASQISSNPQEISHFLRLCRAGKQREYANCCFAWMSLFGYILHQTLHPGTSFRPRTHQTPDKTS